jgi:hypothetical protein
MAKGDILGFIDCPHCGHLDGMRITEDKNGAPFGYCTGNCMGQLRVGGDTERVTAFLKKHPTIAAKLRDKPPPAPDPEPAPALPENDPAPTPKPARRSHLADLLDRT